MNPYQFTAHCQVCGVEGAADSATAAASWYADRVVRHSDPSICAGWLKLAAEKKEEELKQLKLEAILSPFQFRIRLLLFLDNITYY